MVQRATFQQYRPCITGGNLRKKLLFQWGLLPKWGGTREVWLGCELRNFLGSPTTHLHCLGLAPALVCLAGALSPPAVLLGTFQLMSDCAIDFFIFGLPFGPIYMSKAVK